MANLHQLLKAMIEKGASDLHLTTGSPPQLRVDGRLAPLRMDPLAPQDTKQASSCSAAPSPAHSAPSPTRS